MEFYNGKIEELASNLKDLESIVQGKSNNLRVVEDGMVSTVNRTSSPGLTVEIVLRQKVLNDGKSSAAATT